MCGGACVAFGFVWVETTGGESAETREERSVRCECRLRDTIYMYVKVVGWMWADGMLGRVARTDSPARG